MSRLHDESKRLFAEALAIPLEQRRELLRAACQGDEALLAEVQSLLEHHDEIEGFDVSHGGRIGWLRHTLRSVVRAWTRSTEYARGPEHPPPPRGTTGDRPSVDP